MSGPLANPTTGPAGSKQAASKFYRPELDVMRLMAFGLVFLNHAIARVPSHLLTVLKQGGAFGVPIFFALSAFLITELLLREKDISGTVHLKAFYLRRILRIWPLYFLVLCIAAAFVGIRPLIPYAIFLGNLQPMHGLLLRFGFGVLWSISLEEQFYLVWPTLMARLPVKVLPWICLGIWLISQAVALHLTRHGASAAWEWFNPFVQMQYFAIGAGVALILKGRLPDLSMALRGLLIVAGVASFFLLPRYETAAEFLPYLTAGIATAAILYGFLGMSGAMRFKGARYFGKISYGLYVFHDSMIILVEWILAQKLHLQHHVSLFQFPLVLLLTGITAHLSYQYFEKPFLRIKERFEIVHSRTA